MVEQQHADNAQLLINKTVETLRDSGIFTEIFLGAAIADPDGDTRVPLVSCSTVDKQPLFHFLSMCQAMIYDREVNRVEELEKAEQVRAE